MLALKRAADARQYWKHMCGQQARYAKPVDVAALRRQALVTCPNLLDRLAELHRDGVTAIEGYWTQDQCAAARQEIDRMITDYPDCVRRFSNGSDRRMFGVEMAGDACRRFHDDSFLKSVGEIEGGSELYNLATLGARIEATTENRGSGDGWHRDTFGFQFKSIIYLCDVTDQNGPFEYVRGSHKYWRATLDSALGRFPVPPQSRVDNDHMSRMIGNGQVKPKRFTARAGTVILANTTGVHGGAPLKSGSRHALTNYYYFPFQIGRTLIDKFTPMLPGAEERLAPFVEAEKKGTLTA